MVEHWISNQEVQCCQVPGFCPWAKHFSTLWYNLILRKQLVYHIVTEILFNRTFKQYKYDLGCPKNKHYYKSL